MERECRIVNTIIANGAAVSGVVDTTWAAAQGLIAPATLDTNTAIAFKVCDSATGTFQPLYSELNVLVEVPVTINAAKAYALPDAVFAWPYFKLWAENGGTDVAQGTDRAFVIALKS